MSSTPKTALKLGRYRLLNEIAAGGMAVVYRAKLVGAEGFEKDVAIKRILPEWREDPNFTRMLADEAKILVHLNHPNIVPVIELAQEDADLFIVMEFVDGVDLRKLLKRATDSGRTIPPEITLWIVNAIAKALEYAHSCVLPNGKIGIIHRDVSPQNILLSWRGHVKLTDFGIAKTSGPSPHTRTKGLKGKFAYMSPEQARGEELDTRTDIYSLGLVLFEILTGKKAYDGNNDFAILEQARHGVTELPLELDVALRSLLFRLFQPDIAIRQATATALRTDLKILADHLNRHIDAEDVADFLSDLFPEHPSDNQNGFFSEIHPNTQTTRVDEDNIKTLAAAIPETRLWTQTRDLPILSPEEKIHSINLVQTKNVIPKNPKKHFFFKNITILFLIIFSGIGFYFYYVKSKIETAISVPQTEKTEEILIQNNINLDASIESSALQEVKKFLKQMSSFLDNFKQGLISSKIIIPTPNPIEKVQDSPAIFGNLYIEARPTAHLIIPGIGSRRAAGTLQIPTGNHDVTLMIKSPPALQKNLSTVHKNYYLKKNITIKEGKTLFCRAGIKNERAFLICR